MDISVLPLEAIWHCADRKSNPLLPGMCGVAVWRLFILFAYLHVSAVKGSSGGY
jgi:hypothetical protein